MAILIYFLWCLLKCYKMRNFPEFFIALNCGICSIYEIILNIKILIINIIGNNYANILNQNELLFFYELSKSFYSLFLLILFW